jgi:hypothetical protein
MTVRESTLDTSMGGMAPATTWTLSRLVIAPFAPAKDTSMFEPTRIVTASRCSTTLPSLTNMTRYTPTGNCGD